MIFLPQVHPNEITSHFITGNLRAGKREAQANATKHKLLKHVEK
jgi:hypothetical protein